MTQSQQPNPISTEATDLSHLKLLSVFQYIFAGINAFTAMFPIFHLIMGVFMVSGAMTPPPGQAGAGGGSPPPQEFFEFMGWMFIGIGIAVIFYGLVMSILSVMIGLKLGRRHHRTFCIVGAAIQCIVMPLGTILGVFTIVVLMRPSVAQMFSANSD
jgi:hypothetical protein